jgi:hypothetical protein
MSIAECGFWIADLFGQDYRILEINRRGRGERGFLMIG